MAMTNSLWQKVIPVCQLLVKGDIDLRNESIVLNKD
jgi:hypothetical protein